jgi:hypothetical protein
MVARFIGRIEAINLFEKRQCHEWGNYKAQLFGEIPQTSSFIPSPL